MAETELERIKGLEVISGVQQKQLEEHEERLSSLEEIGVIVGKLSEAVTNTSNVVNRLAGIIDDVKDTTQELKMSVARIETQQQYYFIDGVIGIFKKIGLKGLAIIVGCAVAGLTWAQQILHIFG